MLPLISHHEDPRPALLALAGFCLAGTAAAFLVVREGPVPTEAASGRRRVAPLRDRRIWLISGASALILEPQVCLVGFFVVFLHEHRGMTTAGASAGLAVLNLLGVGARIGAGRWSDLSGSRIVPLRRIALASATLVGCSTALVSAPLAVLLPVLVAMGCVTISWNGLAFAATAESAGHARSGTALGIQQTALAVSSAALPIAFGSFVALTSWRAGFAASVAFPLAGWWVLRAVSPSGARMTR